MRIGAAITFLTGLVLGALAVGLPQYLGIRNFGMSVGLGSGALACLIVGVVLWIGAGKLKADRQLLATGQPGAGVIKGVQETGISMQNGMYIVLKFDLEVSSEMASPYMVSCRSTVPRLAIGNVAPGKTVAVKIDPYDQSRVAIDWSAIPS